MKTKIKELAKASGDREKVITELQQASHALELQRESLERERRDKERGYCSSIISYVYSILYYQILN